MKKETENIQDFINFLYYSYLTVNPSLFVFSVQNYRVQTGVDIEKPVEGSEANHEVGRPREKLLSSELR